MSYNFISYRSVGEKVRFTKLQAQALEQIFDERNVLAFLKSPFIINLMWSFQDDSNLYLVMDIALGGDLRFMLSKTPGRGGLPEERVKFYSACIVKGLEHLRENGVVRVKRGVHIGRDEKCSALIGRDFLTLRRCTAT